MRTTILVVFLQMVCCLGTPMVGQVTDSSSEAALRTVMDERRKASLEGDTDKIAGSLAGEYLQTDITGYVQDKTAWLNEYFKPLAELIKAGKFHWEIFEPKDVQIRMYGDTAIAIGTLEAKGSGARYAPTQHTWNVGQTKTALRSCGVPT